jgi:drug/metabolite transporter (DMT)-like permease
MDKNEQLHGILYKVLNLLLYAVVTVCNKAMLNTGMGVEQLFFLSALMGFMSIALFLKFVKHRSLYQLTKGINLKYLFRGALSISGRCAFLYSMTVMGPTVATAISYLRPIFALLMGVFLLSEQITWRMGAALMISIFGAALVTGPLVTTDAHVSMWPILAAFLAPLLWATYDLVVKKQSEKDDWEKQVYLVYLLISVFSFPLALKEWQPVEIKMIFAFLLMGIMYVLIEMSLAKALKRVTLVLIAPITFIRLIFTAVLGYFFVAERINMPTIAGCTLIMVATVVAFLGIPNKKPLTQPSLRDEETN